MIEESLLCITPSGPKRFVIKFRSARHRVIPVMTKNAQQRQNQYYLDWPYFFWTLDDILMVKMEVIRILTSREIHFGRYQNIIFSRNFFSIRIMKLSIATHREPVWCQNIYRQFWKQGSINVKLETYMVKQKPLQPIMSLLKVRVLNLSSNNFQNRFFFFTSELCLPFLAHCYLLTTVTCSPMISF